ncbi:MAG TPA: MCP four helix bundle domain-containing protein, partial [Candidatus Kapabacteria bacterium]|nr:MCP four helix bundle domain-containing protein [Candidatus Kapabacteria bacterium]
MMKIGMKLGIAFSVVTALLILVIYMGINTASTLNEAVQLLAKDRFPKTVWANNIIDALNENARAFRNAMLTNDPKEREKQIRRAKEVAPIVTSNMDSLRINSKTEEERRMVEELKGIRANYIKGREKLFDLISSDKKQEAADYLFGEFRQYQTDYLDIITEIITYHTH